MEKLTVIKIGGNVVDDPALLNEVLEKFTQLQGHKLLVHGGGKLATQLGEKMGLKAQMIDGRRITDAQMLQVVTMVYGGDINKRIVSLLQAKGCNAIGLTGADGNLIPAWKRQDAGRDWGFVGDFEPEKINTHFLNILFTSNTTPVVAPLTHDEEGNMLNTNADTIASGIATALAKQFYTTIVYCFEKKGVLKNVNDPGTLISTIQPQDYSSLKDQGVIADGMIPKLDNAFAALHNGVKKVHICLAMDINYPENGTTLCL